MNTKAKVLYEQIQSENILKYGTAVGVWGPVLLANIYPDGVHFIYELLQNAEDACERAKRAGSGNKFTCTLELSKYQFSMRHNGILFEETDVRGICGIVDGTKSGDESQIGKFGIGFKSCFAYTKSPRIYSGDYSFKIDNYVLPSHIDPKDNLKQTDTLFVIPLDDIVTRASGHDKTVTKETAHEQIKNKLKEIGALSLLFLNNIEQIDWSIDNVTQGVYRRNAMDIGEHSKTVVLSTRKDNDVKSNKYLVFNRSIGASRMAKVEVAFRIESKKENQEKIVPLYDPKFASYFLTNEPTTLGCIIQAPFNTTSARNAIDFEEDWNKKLILETAILIAEALKTVKQLGLLDASFLSTLLIDKEKMQQNSAMSPMYEKIRDVLKSEEALLPTGDGHFISSQQALLVRSKELADLLTPAQLQELFGRKAWLDPSITEITYPAVRRYLMDDLGIPEIGPEEFGRKLTEQFMSKQSDEWVVKFYAFLNHQPALWREKGYYPEGVFRSKPIIRLQNDKHTLPFDGTGKPLAYLPYPISKISAFPTVKQELTEQTEAKEFLINLGLRQPDVVDLIIKGVLPKYISQGPGKTITVVENKQDVKLISTLLSGVTRERNEELLKELKQTPVLFAENYGNQNKEFRKPTEIYVGSPYASNNEVDVYFNGDVNQWKLDSRYIDVANIETLERLGCKSKIHVNHNPADNFGYVSIIKVYGAHRRGLKGFDPNCQIEGLEYVLKNITAEKAEIIWRLLKQNANLIRGLIETSSRQDFQTARQDEHFSMMGELLIKYDWIPSANTQGKIIFKKPLDTTILELLPTFDPSSQESKNIADKLDFKTAPEEIFVGGLSEEDKTIYLAIRGLTLQEKKKVLELIQNFNPVQIEDLTVEEIGNSLKECLEKTGKLGVIGEQTETVWSGLSPEEEIEIRQKYGQTVAQSLREIKVKFGIDPSRKPTVMGIIEPKEFLRAEYKGHCQICNTKIDLGTNKEPYFEILRIFEMRNKHWWTNMEFNVVCLCPNCHARVKYGDNDLHNIWAIAEQITKNQEAPQQVEERLGDYYVVSVKIGNEDRQIYYSPTHMAKLGAIVNKTVKL